jgi:type IV secretory pathway VirB3-like protein
MEIYSAIASILALIGYYLIIQTDRKQRLIGVSIKLIVAIMMHIYFVKLENWSFLLLNIFYLGIDLKLLYQLVRSHSEI